MIVTRPKYAPPRLRAVNRCQENRNHVPAPRVWRAAACSQRRSRQAVKPAWCHGWQANLRGHGGQASLCAATAVKPAWWCQAVKPAWALKPAWGPFPARIRSPSVDLKKAGYNSGVPGPGPRDDPHPRRHTSGSRRGWW